jgi:hypothetical protein
MPPLDDRSVFAFTVFWCPQHEIASHIVHQYARPDYPRELRISQMSGPPDLAPQAYNPPFREYQLWLPAACPTVTGLYPNYQDGGASLVYNIVRFFKVRAISLRVSGAKADHPICEFIFHDSSPQTRIIRAMKDSKWEFYQAGVVQPFEQPDRYTNRLVRERFDPDMALAYCEGLGIEARSSRFWATANATTMKIRA